uniref:Sodefrin-like factor n=1 Tax=Desmognathus monticola TaxID=52103 RepID=Q4FAE0_9SALA|nr:sodefrin precursor-like factor [Desmognathus monticola]
MNALLTGVIFLVAFTATGNSLDCVHCYSNDGTDCSGEAITCTDDMTHCRTITSEIMQDGDASHQVFKFCGREKEPTTIYREESSTTFFQVESHYCETDNCNQGPGQITPRDNTPNGVKCKQCFVEHSADCDTEETTECTGDMNKCLFTAGLVCNNGIDFYVCAQRSCTNIASPEQYPFYYEVTAGNIHKLEITEGISDV